MCRQITHEVGGGGDHISDEVEDEDPFIAKQRNITKYVAEPELGSCRNLCNVLSEKKNKTRGAKRDYGSSQHISRYKQTAYMFIDTKRMQTSGRGEGDHHLTTWPEVGRKISMGSKLAEAPTHIHKIKRNPQICPKMPKVQKGAANLPNLPCTHSPAQTIVSLTFRVRWVILLNHSKKSGLMCLMKGAAKPAKT